jgi:hypothetical protein
LLRLSVVAWSVAARDYHGEDAVTMADRVGRQMRPGDIILFHDSLFAPRDLDEGGSDRLPTLEAVRIILEQWGDSFRFVTLPELMGNGYPERELWFFRDRRT